MPAEKVRKLADSGFAADNWTAFGAVGDEVIGGLPFLNNLKVSDDESAKERFGFETFDEYKRSEYNVGGRISFPRHDYWFYGEFCDLLKEHTDFDGTYAPISSTWSNKDEGVWSEIVLCKQGWGKKLDVVSDTSIKTHPV